MPETAAPPKWILVLLWAFKGEPCYPQIEGDLEEEFHLRESDYGIAAARRWYYREVCRNIWSLIWRWTTLQAIVVPPLCILFYSFMGPILLRAPSRLLFEGIFRISNSTLAASSATFLLKYLNLGIVGVALGIVCSLILQGHERMLRLAFVGFFLTLIVVTTGPRIGWLIHQHWIALLETFISLICFPLGFSMGSMWIERRQRRPRAAQFHP